ncbi:MAG TPA: methyltransferase domain-containing protein, partial [Streptosporangiaceae bacterium]|nr:methyltransferase domain-containing protein [Streptosporangiaceae bacterium]
MTLRAPRAADLAYGGQSVLGSPKPNRTGCSARWAAGGRRGWRLLPVSPGSAGGTAPVLLVAPAPPDRGAGAGGRLRHRHRGPRPLGHPGVSSVVGVDPSRQFIQRARALSRDDPVLRFEVGNGTALPCGDQQFDVAVFATTLCHVIDPRAALGEAFRVLVPGGTLLVFDGDYATATVAQHRDDPLQACVTAAVTRLIHDPWLVRRLRTLVAAAGFVAPDLESHGYVESGTATYMSTLVDFGASALAQDATVSTELADALKAEARNRVASGTFFGHMAYASVLATRPITPQAYQRRPRQSWPLTNYYDLTSGRHCRVEADSVQSWLTCVRATTRSPQP